MTLAAPLSTQQDALTRLVRAELDAQARIQEAQSSAKRIQMEATAAGDHLLNTAQTQANADAQRFLDAAVAQASADGQQHRDEVEADIEAMTARAQLQLDAAVTWLLSWVTGEEC